MRMEVRPAQSASSVKKFGTIMRTDGGTLIMTAESGNVGRAHEELEIINRRICKGN